MASLTAARDRRIGRALLPLGLVFLAVGISTAIIGPFLSLFLSDAVHAGPVRVTVFLVVAPLSGVLASTLLGRLSDRRPIRRALLIGASLAGLIGCVLIAVIRDYWILATIPVGHRVHSLGPDRFAAEVVPFVAGVRQNA